MPSAPAASCAHGVVSMHTSIHNGRTGNHPAFPHAMVLTVYFVLSPAIGCFATVASRVKVLSGTVEPNEPPQDLTPASRRQDHTTSPSASAPSSCVLKIAHGEQSALRSRRTPDAARVHRIPSRVRDDRDTPLMWDETAADMEVIWVGTEREYFSLWVSTDPTTPNLARRAWVFRIRASTDKFRTRLVSASVRIPD